LNSTLLTFWLVADQLVVSDVSFQRAPREVSAAWRGSILVLAGRQLYPISTHLRCREYAREWEYGEYAEYRKYAREWEYRKYVEYREYAREWEYRKHAEYRKYARECDM
jgi:hypothetical protein